VVSVALLLATTTAKCVEVDGHSTTIDPRTGIDRGAIFEGFVKNLLTPDKFVTNSTTGALEEPAQA
jgi:hypothetical protein